MPESNDDYMAERAEWVFYPRVKQPEEPKDQTFWWLFSGLMFGCIAGVVACIWGRV
jgi:hypothetical protein